jgi:hypothetical protein
MGREARPSSGPCLGHPSLAELYPNSTFYTSPRGIWGRLGRVAPNVPRTLRLELARAPPVSPARTVLLPHSTRSQQLQRSDSLHAIGRGKLRRSSKSRAGCARRVARPPRKVSSLAQAGFLESEPQSRDSLVRIASRFVVFACRSSQCARASSPPKNIRVKFGVQQSLEENSTACSDEKVRKLRKNMMRGQWARRPNHPHIVRGNS